MATVTIQMSGLDSLLAGIDKEFKVMSKRCQPAVSQIFRPLEKSLSGLRTVSGTSVEALQTVETGLQALETILSTSEQTAVDLASAFDLAMDSMQTMTGHLGGCTEAVAGEVADAGQKVLAACPSGVEIMDAAMDAVMANADGGGNPASAALGTVKGAFLNRDGSAEALEGLVRETLDLETDFGAIKYLFADVQKAMLGMSEEQRKSCAGIIDGVDGAITWVSDHVPAVAGFVTDGVDRVWSRCSPVLDSLKTKGAGVYDFLETMWNMPDEMGRCVEGILNFTDELGKIGLENVLEGWAEDPGRIYSDIVSGAEGAMAWMTDNTPGLAGLVTAGMDQIGSRYGPVLDGLKAKGADVCSFLGTVWEMPDTLGSYMDHILNLTGDLGGLEGAIATLPGRLSTYAGEQWNLLQLKAQDRLETLELCGLYAQDLVGALGSGAKEIGAFIGQQAELTAAKLQDKLETLELCAMYAKDLVMAIGGGVRALAKSAAAWVAEKAAIVASKAATLAMKGVQLVSAGATSAMTAAQWALNAAFSASPMGMIVLAIGALIAIGVLLVKNWDKIRAAALALWEGIKGAFAGLGEWFSGIWQGIQASFGTVIGGIRDGALALWEGIKEVFGGVGDWFSGIWEGVKAGFGELVGGIRDGALALWEGIQEMFGGVGDWFSGIWEGVKEGFRGFINAIISGLNSISVEIPDWVPLVGGKSLGFNIPELAEGGIATNPTLAMVGEGMEAEAILPLSSLEGMLDMQSGLEADAFAGFANGFGAVEVSLPDSYGAGPLRGLLEQLSEASEPQPTLTGGDIVYSPTFTIEGPADHGMLETVARDSFEQFKIWHRQLMAEQKRKGLSRDAW